MHVSVNVATAAKRARIQRRSCASIMALCDVCVMCDVCVVLKFSDVVCVCVCVCECESVAKLMSLHVKCRCLQ